MNGPSLERWAETLIGTTLVARYRLDALLGVGGMGAVFEATNLSIQRRVAIKLMHPHVGSDRVSAQRFAQEARAAASIDRDGVVEVFDLQQDPTYGPFIVMERLEGESLSARTLLLGRIPLNEAVAIALAVLDVLHVVHSKGIVHRDLKPSNVFLAAQHDDTECVKVLDFGISHIPNASLDEPLTAPGIMLGTARFMAPEQAHDPNAVDHRADLYAVGALLYSMLAGTHPFRGLDAQTVFGLLRKGVVPSLQQLSSDVPSTLSAVIDRAMSLRPEQRFASAAEMKHALTPWDLPALHHGRGLRLSRTPADTSSPALHTVNSTQSEHATVHARKESPTPATPSNLVAKPDRRKLWIMLGLFGSLVIASSLWLATRTHSNTAQHVALAAQKPTPNAPVDVIEHVDKQSLPGASVVHDAGHITATNIPQDVVDVHAQATLPQGLSPIFLARFHASVVAAVQIDLDNVIDPSLRPAAELLKQAREAFGKRDWSKVKESAALAVAKTLLQKDSSFEAHRIWYEAQYALLDVRSREVLQALPAVTADYAQVDTAWSNQVTDVFSGLATLITESTPMMTSCMSLRAGYFCEEVGDAFAARQVPKGLVLDMALYNDYARAGRNSWWNTSLTYFQMAAGMQSSESCAAAGNASLQRAQGKIVK